MKGRGRLVDDKCPIAMTYPRISTAECRDVTQPVLGLTDKVLGTEVPSTMNLGILHDLKSDGLRLYAMPKGSGGGT